MTTLNLIGENVTCLFRQVCEWLAAATVRLSVRLIRSYASAATLLHRDKRTVFLLAFKENAYFWVHLKSGCV